ncbi:J domain-containing protein [Shimia sagamensis]|uniref:DnaJ domain-containing protein n=1 Tax=Shimia sagamensis TaxID=1566352 RepID=A0ABY1N8F2_9RHOB|nr:J domain-containing protein [Shimia sagamensis]SMP03266.1 DnaJ domain-containing protein [Shimia sagamensis]
MAQDLTYAYDLLQVTPTTSVKEMQAAWRKLARRYHPDLAKINPEEASRRMSEINAAYDAVAHHRALKDEQPKPRARRRSRTARQAAECQAWRRQRDAMARKAAKAWQAAQTEQTANTAPQIEKTKPRQTALTATAKWNRTEQSLINTARAAFEGTRKTLSTAARRPAFSACH